MMPNAGVKLLLAASVVSLSAARAPAAAPSLEVASRHASDRDAAQTPVIERLAEIKSRGENLRQDFKTLKDEVQKLEAELQSQKQRLESLRESTLQTMEDFRTDMRWYFTVVVLGWSSLVAALLGIGYEIWRKLTEIDERLSSRRRAEEPPILAAD